MSDTPDSASVVKKKRRSGSETRQRDRVISVRVHDDEGKIIDVNAAAAGLSDSAFLRTLGTGFRRSHERRRPLPELEPYNRGLGKFNVAASNLHQLLRLARMGVVVAGDELRRAAVTVETCADEVLDILRGQR